MVPPVRRFFAVGLWLGVTATATAIVWAGTSTVAADLTDRPAPFVAHHDVVSALESGSTGADTAPGITTPDATVPTPPLPPDAAGTPEAASPAPEPAPSASPAPSPGAVTPPAPATPPVTEAPTPPTTAPPDRPTATYSTGGGVVTVACNNTFLIELVSATPTNGYAARVVSAGPYYVEVHFVRAGSDQPLWAYCLGSPIRAYGGSQIPQR